MAPIIHHTLYFEVLEALGEPGCAFCRLGTRTVARYLDSLAYENVNDVSLRATIREALGLCNRHAWQFVQETREPLGTAIIYRDLIRTLQRRTSERAARVGLSGLGSGARRDPRRQALIPNAPCVACAALRTAIHDCAHLLVDGWSDSALRGAFATSEGLCWSHLLTTLNLCDTAEKRRDVVAVQRAAWERRLARARRFGQPALLVEALCSAPRMTGAQVDPPPRDAGAFAGVEDVDTPSVPSGHCPACAGIEAWLRDVAFPGEEAPDSTVSDVGVGILCSVHAWLPGHQPRVVDVAGLARKLQHLEARLVDLLENDGDRPAILRWANRYRRKGSLSAELTAELGCSLCCRQARLEDALVARVDASALCVPHLRVASSANHHFDSLLIHTRRTWHAVEKQLDEYVRKHDYRFQHEPIREERDSPSWAVALLAGRDGIR